MQLKSKNQILDAADNLFGTTGFDATTTREIAEMSGVNKALIHYHFGSKEVLLEKVLDRYYQKLTASIESAVAGDLELRDRLICLIDTYVDFLNDNKSFSRIVQREASGGKHINLVRKQMVPIFQLGQALVDDAFPNLKDGSFAAEQIMVSFYGMIVAYFTYGETLEYLIDDDPFSEARLLKRKQHLHRMLDIVLASALEEAQ